MGYPRNAALHRYATAALLLAAACAGALMNECLPLSRMAHLLGLQALHPGGAELDAKVASLGFVGSPAVRSLVSSEWECLATWTQSAHDESMQTLTARSRIRFRYLARGSNSCVGEVSQGKTVLGTVVARMLEAKSGTGKKLLVLDRIDSIQDYAAEAIGFIESGGQSFVGRFVDTTGRIGKYEMSRLSP